MDLAFVPVATWRSLDEAARQTGISRRTLNRWLSEGKLTPYRIAGDRRRFVDLDEVKRLRKPQPLDR
jgi:excisionase family DNA binding protein